MRCSAYAPIVRKIADLSADSPLLAEGCRPWADWGGPAWHSRAEEPITTNVGAEARSDGLGADGDFRLDSLRYRYRHQRRDSLHVERATLPAGRATAVTGLNGAGKSTFARCLQGLDSRCKGVLVTPDGRRLDRRGRLGACFTVMQDVNCELFAESVLDEIELAQPHEDRDAAMAVLRRLDLE